MEDLRDKLKYYAKSGTPAEKKIARYFSDHLSDLSYETAASIADRLDLSPMTVGRFLRSLGYHGLDDLKGTVTDRSRASPWLISDAMEVLQHDLKAGRLLAEFVAEQMDLLQKTYNLTTEEAWPAAVDAIVQARCIFVASFQNIGGIARYFSDQLTYARAHVFYMDGQNGTYMELFDRAQEGALLIVIDSERYSTKSKTLARMARKSGLQVLLITDQYCDWVRDDAHHSLFLTLPPARSRTWASGISLTALLDMLVTCVTIASGTQTVERTRHIASLQDAFADFAKR